MEFGVVTSLLGVVEQQLIQQPHPCFILPAHTHQIIQSLSHKLRFLQAYLKDSNPEVQKDLHQGIRDVAAESEYKIESKLSEVYLAAEHAAVEAACEDLHQILQQVVKDIELVEVRIRELQVTPTASIHDASLSTPSSLELADTRDGGFSKYDLEAEKIKNMLIYSSLEKQQVSIVGMGGLGKTTLARKVYEDPSVSDHFHIRAWITVSQQYSRSQVLIDLLRCIVSLTSEMYEKWDFKELQERLYKSLKGLRYLIVIDDIWSTEAWDDIKICFPDDRIGSRVLITTRMKEIAEYATSSEAFIYHMRFLDPVESWNLFVRKVFKGGVCPPQLESIGRKIVEKCGGLPLTIGVVAGLLAKFGMSPEQWEHFAQNISEFKGMESHSVSRAVALSYNNLPTHLQTCFLYLGIFPGDSDIHVKKLIRLWAAEGFLESRRMGDESLEEVAMDYLNDLIARNLVLVVKRGFNGEVKSCGLHDSLRNFCLGKAQEENMLVVSNEYHDNLARMEQSSKPGCRWMSCQSRGWPITPSNSLNYNWGNIRSILYFRKDLYLRKCRFIFPCLKLLRVLDLSLIKYWNGIPSEIVNLIHLRYLALTTTGSLYNFPLFKLQSLQTLVLLSWMEECHLQLPGDILDLPWLRHVHLDKGSSLDLPNSVQENLQTLFWLKVGSWGSNPPNFTRVPNLKELGIYIDGEVSRNVVDGLVQLYHLKKLKFELGRVEHFCLPISFPPNLKKLTLRKTYLPWEEMDIIGKLPNLEVLKLKDFAFCGPVWESSNGTFHKLKLLLIAHSDLEHWNADSDSDSYYFPVLECLVLRCCWYLKELPEDFALFSKLRLIELIDCCPSLVTSAKMIQEDRLVFGFDDVVVRHSLTEGEYYEEESDELSQEESDKSAV